MIENQKKYLINFTIPQGPTGPVGFISVAYGCLYQTSKKIYNIEDSSSIMNFIFDKKTVERNIFLNVDDSSILILESGIYDIDFKINLISDKDVTIKVYDENIDDLELSQFIPQSYEENNSETTLQFRTIIPIQEGNILKLNFKVNTSCTLTSSDGYFIVTKISDL